MTAHCLACVAGLSTATYCQLHPAQLGCPDSNEPPDASGLNIVDSPPPLQSPSLRRSPPPPQPSRLPPVSSPPPSPPAVLLVLDIAGAVADFESAHVRSALTAKIAGAAGVDPPLVSLTFLGGSIRLFATVTVPVDRSARAVANAVSDRLGTAASASAALGVEVLAEPEVAQMSLWEAKMATAATPADGSGGLQQTTLQQTASESAGGGIGGQLDPALVTALAVGGALVLLAAAVALRVRCRRAVKSAAQPQVATTIRGGSKKGAIPTMVPLADLHLVRPSLVRLGSQSPICKVASHDVKA